MRRKDKERDAAFAWQVMKTAMYATVSLVDEQGEPYAVPISQGAWQEGSCIYFHCALAGRKYDIFKNGCRAVISAVGRAEVIPDVYTMSYTSAVAKGQLEMVTDPAERMQAMEILCRQFDPAAGEKFVECMKNEGARTCIMRLAVEEITGKEGNG